MASKLTKHDLDNVTDYIEFESFCHDLMSREGFKDIEPLGGNKDKGRDAIHVDKLSAKVTIFVYSVREDWEEKLYEDLEKIAVVHKHSCDRVIFLTTGSPTATQKDNVRQAVKKTYGFDLEIYDLERIATLVDNQYQELRLLHSNIFFVSSHVINTFSAGKDLDRTAYAEYVLRLHEEWLQRYTPLLAKHREVDTYAVLTGKGRTNAHDIPVGMIPEAGGVSVLLGDSGSGKTTALWRIGVEASKAIVDGKSEKLPVLFSMKGWSNSHTCRDLVQDQFDLLDVSREAVEQELLKGNCLLLIDGLNEIPESLRTEAYQDLGRFLTQYQKNSVLICCRAADYEPRMLDPERSRRNPRVYEIRRMGREQIIDYVHKYFKGDERSALGLLSKLDVDNDELWREPTSLIQLATIPLYLQLFIIEYERSNQLPNNQAKLLKVLIDTLLEREKDRKPEKLDSTAKERLLSSFAYAAILQGYWLRFPEYIARDLFKELVGRLKNENLIQTDLTVGAVWQEVISGNFLTIANRPSIEWLHQLICDYFLGCEIVHVWSFGSSRDKGVLTSKLSRNKWGLPCEVALSILDPRSAAKFLELLIQVDDELARRSFEGQIDNDQRTVAELLILEILEESDSETKRLDKIAVTLPTKALVEILIDKFNICKKEMEVVIARAISLLMMEHGSIVAAQRSGFDVSGAMEARRYELLSSAVRRAADLLTAWTNNSNESVAFYAAKGLWAFERDLAATTLRRLLGSSNPETSRLVKDLMDEWSIE